MCTQENVAAGLKLPTVLLKPLSASPKAANIAACSVTTDSVVATVTVEISGTMRRIVVQWGDGMVNTLRNRPGIDAAAIGQNSQLPPGIYKLSHAYVASEDRKPFSHIVIVRVEDAAGIADLCIHEITLTPRYRVTQYRTRLNLESRCDSAFESNSEFDIRFFVKEQLVAAWRWQVGQSFIPNETIVLDGSLVSRELTVADGAVRLHLELTERDPIWDDHLSAWMSLSATDVSGSISNVTEGDGCKVRYSYDKEVMLIVPLPSYGQTVVATTGQ